MRTVVADHRPKAGGSVTPAISTSNPVASWFDEKEVFKVRHYEPLEFLDSSVGALVNI